MIIKHQEKQDRTDMSDEIILVHSESLGDWFTIEWKEHDGREWLEPIDGGASCEMSCRISDACVEGTLVEMREIAEAIRQKDEFCAKRCAVKVLHNNTVLFSSPRNSRISGKISYASALKLADQIGKICKEN